MLKSLCRQRRLHLCLHLRLPQDQCILRGTSREARPLPSCHSRGQWSRRVPSRKSERQWTFGANHLDTSCRRREILRHQHTCQADMYCRDFVPSRAEKNHVGRHGTDRVQSSVESIPSDTRSTTWQQQRRRRIQLHRWDKMPCPCSSGHIQQGSRRRRWHPTVPDVILADTRRSLWLGWDFVPPTSQQDTGYRTQSQEERRFYQHTRCTWRDPQPVQTRHVHSVYMQEER